MPIILFGALLLFSANLGADWTERSAQFHFNHMGSELTPLAISQSADGWIWIAAKEGFFRFDGHRFFPVIAPAGINLSGARGLAIGPGSLVWLATDNGLFRWDSGSISLAMGLATDAVVVSRRGNVFAVCRSSISTPTDRPKLFALMSVELSWREIPSMAQAAIRESSRGEILIANGVRMARIEESRLTKLIELGRPLAFALSTLAGLGDSRASQTWWRDVMEDREGRMWGRSGLDVFSFYQGKIARFSSFTNDQSRYRDTFFEDSNARLWVMGKTLQLASPSGLVNGPKWSNSFENVTAMFEDQKGTLWIGQERRGLTAVVDERSLQIWGKDEGLEGGVNAIARSADGELFAATPNGIRRLDRPSGVWKSWSDLDQRITSVAATAAGGLLAVPKQPERTGPFSFFEFDSTVNPSRRKNMIWNTDVAYFRPRLAVAGAGGVDWLAAVEAAHRRETGSGWRPVAIPGGSYVSDIQIASDGSAYIGHEFGVSFCLKWDCTAVLRLADGLLDKRVRSIAVSPEEIWIAYRTPSGFSRYRKSGNSWQPKHFLPSNGYGPADTHFIRRDSRGWIWRGTPDGVFVCDGVHLEPENWIQLRFGPQPDDSDANLYGFFEGVQIFV